MNKTDNTSVTNASQPEIKVTTPYGALHFESFMDVQDHAHMRAGELHAFLVLISTEEGLKSFTGLNGEMRNSLIWMASRAAGELDELLSQVSFDAARVAK